MNTLYAKISTGWKNHFVGYSELAIILSTCLGSIAVMLTMMDGNGFPQMWKKDKLEMIKNITDKDEYEKIIKDILVFNIFSKM